MAMLSNETVRELLIETTIWIDGAPACGEWHAWMMDLKSDGWRAGVLISLLTEAERERVREFHESQAEWRAARLGRVEL